MMAKAKGFIWCPQCGQPHGLDAKVCPRTGVAMPTSPHPRGHSRQVGRIINGRYFIRSLLGSGGMAVVYEVEQISVGRRLAMKILRPQLARNVDVVRRFQREARI